MRFYSTKPEGSDISYYFPYEGLLSDFYSSSFYRRVHSILVSKGFRLRYILNNVGYYESSEGIPFSLKGVGRNENDTTIAIS